MVIDWKLVYPLFICFFLHLWYVTLDNKNFSVQQIKDYWKSKSNFIKKITNYLLILHHLVIWVVKSGICFNCPIFVHRNMNLYISIWKSVWKAMAIPFHLLHLEWFPDHYYIIYHIKEDYTNTLDLKLNFSHLIREGFSLQVIKLIFCSSVYLKFIPWRHSVIISISVIHQLLENKRGCCCIQYTIAEVKAIFFTFSSLWVLWLCSLKPYTSKTCKLFNYKTIQGVRSW